MEKQSLTNPISGDEVPKVDNAVAVGEDLEFQERWWKLERLIWSLFALILIADVLGFFGRGWFAKARLLEPDSGIAVNYERVERASTPSIMTIRFLPESIVNGSAQLFVSNSIVKQLGAQRIAPQPERSIIGDGGITYSFAASGSDADVQIALEPSFPGYREFSLQVPGKKSVGAHVVVVP